MKGCPLLPSPLPGYTLLLWGPSAYRGPTGSLEEKAECSTAGSRELGSVLVSEDSMMAIHIGTVFCCLVHCSGPFLPPPLRRKGQPAIATFSALLVFALVMWKAGDQTPHFLPTPSSLCFCPFSGSFPLTVKSGGMLGRPSEFRMWRDFAGGLVVKTLCFQCRACGFDTWSRN